MRIVISSLEGEFRRYRTLAAKALAQLSDAELDTRIAAGNSAATLVRHIAGNLVSRFTDFLTSDGEKPWRDRESEFVAKEISRSELLVEWDEGWSRLFDALAPLGDAQLTSIITIRGVEMSVLEALHRSLAHVSYHVGQIVLIARSIRGEGWQFLSIPPGGSDAYNTNPDREKPG